MFRRGPYDRPILMLAAPTFGALVAEPVYVLTDTAIVGHLGTDQLAGLAVAAAVLLSAHALLLFLAYGTTSLVGRLMGSGDHRAAARQGVQALWLALVLGALASVALGVWSGPLVDIFQPTAAVRDHALTYLRISLVGFTGLLVTLAGTGYLRGLHNTTTPLKVALISAVANLVLELVLVFGLDTGIAGSAWSTAISQSLDRMSRMDSRSSRDRCSSVFATWASRPAARQTLRTLSSGWAILIPRSCCLTSRS